MTSITPSGIGAVAQADYIYQTAGGTGTAITLTINQTLVNGSPVNFIASADNGGSSTTINSKPVYKPGTTTPPTIKATKPYTVIYNNSGDNFFLKASAEGTTIAAHVLAGDTFSNNIDTGLVGTLDLSNLVSGNLRSGVTISNGLTNITGKSSVVDTSDALATAAQLLSSASAYVNGVKINGSIPNRGTYQYCGGIGSGNDGNSYVAFNGIPYGYYQSNNGGWSPEIRAKKSDIANAIGLTSANLVSGNTVLDVVGSYDPLTLVPGDGVVLYQRDGNLGTSSSTYTLIESHVVQGRGGAVRIKFSVSCAGSSSGVVGYTRIYVNGSPRGIEHTMCSASVVTFTEDISINAGDTIQLYVHPATAGYNETISEFIICCGNNYGYVS